MPRLSTVPVTPITPATHGRLVALTGAISQKAPSAIMGASTSKVGAVPAPSLPESVILMPVLSRYVVFSVGIIHLLRTNRTNASPVSLHPIAPAALALDVALIAASLISLSIRSKSLLSLTATSTFTMACRMAPLANKHHPAPRAVQPSRTHSAVEPRMSLSSILVAVQNLPVALVFIALGLIAAHTRALRRVRLQ
jgi:hypothetical protein